MCLELFLISAAIVLAIIWFWTLDFSHWKDRGIPGPTPSLFFGNTKSFYTSSESYCLEVEEIYNKYKDKGLPVVGYYAGRTPHLLALDLCTVKEIMMKNFHHFYDNEAADMMSLSSDPIMGRNPFFQKSVDWKGNRKELVPGFSMNKIKSYYPIMKSVCQKLTNYIDKQCQKSPEVDIDNLTGRFATELVADIIFGVTANALSDTVDSLVLRMGNKFISNFANVTSFFVWTGILPFLKKIYKFRLIAEPESKFFKGLIRASLKSRENGETRDDFIQFLLGLKEKRDISLTEMTSHAMTFYLEGYDTCSLAIANALQELAKNQYAQNKLREEIQETLDAHEGELSFYNLMDMDYLDAVVNESLRLKPPFSMLIRQCTKDFQFKHPDHAEPIQIEKGTPVMIHVAAIHRDPKYYEHPMEFDPDRFYLKDLRKLNADGMLLSFGGGPRTCLGMKFGLAQLKLCIYEIIKNYKISEEVEDGKGISASPAHFFGYPSKRIFLKMERI